MINQPINRSINQPINITINQSIYNYQSINITINQSITQINISAFTYQRCTKTVKVSKYYLSVKNGSINIESYFRVLVFLINYITIHINIDGICEAHRRPTCVHSNITHDYLFVLPGFSNSSCYIICVVKYNVLCQGSVIVLVINCISTY